MSSPKYEKRPLWLSFMERTNFTVTGLTALAIVLTRSAGVAFFGAGALTCTLSVKYILKRIIRQPRPAFGTKTTYGMPSTHSATIGYYGTYVTLASIYLPLHPSISIGEWARVAAPVIVVPWAALIATSRILLGHHTIAQVVVGVAYGMLFAGSWLLLWMGGAREYGPAVEELLNLRF